MELKDLQKNAEIYFKKGAKKMYATLDGNLFYEEHKAFADSHSNSTKQELIVLVPEKIEEKAYKAPKIKKIESEITESEKVKEIK